MPNFKSILHKKTYALTFRVADQNKKLKLEMNNSQNGKSMFKIRWQCQFQASATQWALLFHVLMLCLQKSPTIIIIISDPCWNLLDVFFKNPKEVFVQALNQGRRNAISI